MFKIVGGNSLSGRIKVGGSKNTALPIMAFTTIQEGKYILKNVPLLNDTLIMAKLLESLGLIVERQGNKYTIINEGIKNYEAHYDLVSKMRASFVVSGPLLANIKRAKVSLPGGCAIGPRPVNYHLDAFKQLGVNVSIEHGYVDMFADRLIGTDISLPHPSVGASQNIIAAACKAEGITKIDNASRDPDVVEPAKFLKKMGAKIHGIGTSSITIEGNKSMHGIEYEISPDRIEAGTFIILSQLFDGSIIVEDINEEHLSSLLTLFKSMGAKFEIEKGNIKILSKLSELKATNISTLPYPGFPTDLQPPMMVLLSMLKGNSIIQENIFQNRLTAVSELTRMGAKIKVADNHTAYLEGIDKFSSAEVTAPDLRGGISLVLAALLAEGESIINKSYHIDRGYENLEIKLSQIGADIIRLEK